MRITFRTLALLLGLAWTCTPGHAQTSFTADAKVSVKSYIVANNTTALVVKTTPGVVYQVDAYANGTTLAYVKLYNAASATCGSGTPQARYLVPYGAASTGGGFVAPIANGDVYSTGIVMCVTGGIADADTTSPAASTFIVNVHYK